MSLKKQEGLKENHILGNTLHGVLILKDLEKVLKNAKTRRNFRHIVSINPEILIISTQRRTFKDVITKAQSQIIDGAGVVVAMRLLYGIKLSRLTGVDMLEWVLEHAHNYSLRVLLIGGKEKLAEELADCYIEKNSRLDVRGLQGIRNISQIEESEEKHIFSIVADYKPHFVFVAFGSPAQEEWIEANKEKFAGCTIAGVGGAFDFLTGTVPRSPLLMRNLGLEWLYRLVKEPWRWKRQLRLVSFIILVVLERLGLKRFN